MRTNSIFARTIVMVMFVAACVSAALAQTTVNGSLRGRISDANGSVIAGASTTLTNKETNRQLTATTDENGQYGFPRLAPGNYTLAIEHAGFSRMVRDSVVITVDEVVVADVVLAVGQVRETVTVEGGASSLQAQSAEISGLVNERRVRELPLNGKDFNKLIALAPGVVITPASSSGSPAVSGARTTANNYALDGVAANDERVDGLPPGGGFNTIGNAVPNIISTEALREFRIITSNADATYGRGSGGQINVYCSSHSSR